MDPTEKVARALAELIESDEEAWKMWEKEAAHVVLRCGPQVASLEDEAWKTAQLAAILIAGASGPHTQAPDLEKFVNSAGRVLAESRRQAAAATEG